MNGKSERKNENLFYLLGRAIKVHNPQFPQALAQTAVTDSRSVAYTETNSMRVVKAPRPYL